MTFIGSIGEIPFPLIQDYKNKQDFNMQRRREIYFRYTEHCQQKQESKSKWELLENEQQGQTDRNVGYIKPKFVEIIS